MDCKDVKANPSKINLHSFTFAFEVVKIRLENYWNKTEMEIGKIGKHYLVFTIIYTLHIDIQYTEYSIVSLCDHYKFW